MGGTSPLNTVDNIARTKATKPVATITDGNKRIDGPIFLIAPNDAYKSGFSPRATAKRNLSKPIKKNKVINKSTVADI